MARGSGMTLFSFISRGSSGSTITFDSLCSVSSRGPLRSGGSRRALVTVLTVLPWRSLVSFIAGDPWQTGRSWWSRRAVGTYALEIQVREVGRLPRLSRRSLLSGPSRQTVVSGGSLGAGYARRASQTRRPWWSIVSWRPRSSHFAFAGGPPVSRQPRLPS